MIPHVQARSSIENADVIDRAALAAAGEALTHLASADASEAAANAAAVKRAVPEEKYAAALAKMAQAATARRLARVFIASHLTPRAAKHVSR